eukprot:g44188.t1
MWEALKDQLIKVQDIHVPAKLKNRNGKIQEPWMTRGIVSLGKRKKDAYDRSRQLQTDEAFEEYKEIRKELKCRMRRDKRGREMSLPDSIKENPKTFYAYIRRKRVARDRAGPLEDKGGKLCMESQEVGEILNEYFVLVFTKEKDMIDAEVRDECANTLQKVNILTDEVL